MAMEATHFARGTRLSSHGARADVCDQCGGRGDAVTARRDTPEKRKGQVLLNLAFENNPGSDLLSHTVTRAVPSAVAGLTSVFGMGTGVTLPL